MLEGSSFVDDDYFQTYQKWLPWVENFLTSIHYKYGSFTHLPFNGGVLDQPAITMKIFKIIQGEYLQYLKRENK